MPRNRINARKRFLVLASNNSVIKPSDHPELSEALDLALQSDGSPSHTTLESAKLFAGALAAANLGERYYVVATLAAVCTQVAPAIAPADSWVDTAEASATPAAQ